MKVAYVSSMLPSGHYSQYLTEGLDKLRDLKLLVYTEKDPKNLEIEGCGLIKTVWSKSVRYVFQIVRELRIDKPDVVHLQQELNMYGGLTTVILFPVLLFLIRVLGFKVVTTVHAVVYKSQINDSFVHLFHRDPKFLKPFYLKLFFYFLYKTISLFSNQIIVHTNLTRNILVSDYGVNALMVKVIPISIPERQIKNAPRQKYFLYFGYMVRRKGLQYVLEGFKKYLESNPKSDYSLVLAGGVINGQENANNEILEVIKANHLEKHVVVKGFVDEKDLDELYLHAVAVVIPAVLSMGSSGPLFHAVSYGKCVITSKIGHFLEDIDHLETGILTDNSKWDEAIQFVVNNPAKMSLIEGNVLEKARSRTPFIIASKHREVYQELVGCADV